MCQSYKTTLINNRRYLGNKYRLLPFIKQVVTDHCQNVNAIADLFAGTGAVSSAFQDRQIITNDILYSNYISNLAWFSPQEYNEQKIIAAIEKYNAKQVHTDNYMSRNFANTFFSKQDCRKIGYIREDIERMYRGCEINECERALLITSLLYAMDKIAKTCGHYDAYRQGVEFDQHLELAVPLASHTNSPNNLCYNQDINQLAPQIKADLVYLDPPYNSRQYCDAYHVLENVARWEKPEVFGVARKMDRTNLKSAYCTKEATAAFENLIQSVNAHYILLSYNNMEKKGNERSNAKLADEDILRILQAKGQVQIFEVKALQKIVDMSGTKATFDYTISYTAKGGIDVFYDSVEKKLVFQKKWYSTNAYGVQSANYVASTAITLKKVAKLISAIEDAQNLANSQLQ